MKNLLIVDDDSDSRLLLTKFLTKNGFSCTSFHSGKMALQVIKSQPIDLVLCDSKLRDMSAPELLKAIKNVNANIPVIVMTGYSHVKTAVEVMQLGAIDYLIKPLILTDIIGLITATLTALGENKGITSKNSKRTIKAGNTEPSYVLSPHKSSRNILKQIDLVAPTNYSVIIYGESGSGKEAFAHEIHMRSTRKNKAFEAVDCGTLTTELAGSELFGHERGAFTGALNQKIGVFESAEGGTIFLDEIANLPYDIQSSLLRAVQERKIRRIGGNEDIDIDVRIIVASNVKLWEASQAGTFRADLYHRFNEFAIEVLPLRERKEDIPFYAAHFIKAGNGELDKDIQGFTDEAMEAMLNYSWPGNLRELKNMVKRSVLITETKSIGVEVFPIEIHHKDPVIPEIQYKTDISRIGSGNKATEDEYNVIVSVLEGTNFNKKETSKILNMDIRTMQNKMKKFGDLIARDNKMRIGTTFQQFGQVA